MQKDLFGATTLSPFPNTTETKSDFLQRFRIQLKLDQTIIVALLLVVVYVLVFSFGVESGKRYAMAEIKAERAMRERMTRELGEKIFANNQPQQALVMKSGTEQAKITSTAAAQTTAKATPVIVSETKKIEPQSQTPKISASGKYLIQTVTYTSKAAAEQELKRLMGKGYGGKILPRGKFQQVCVGGFENRSQATQALGQLQSQGLAPKDAYIRTLG